MKQFWIFLISICCTLTALGQHQNTDSTQPEKSTPAKTGASDSGQATHAAPAQKQATPTVPKADSGNTQRSNAINTGKDTGSKASGKALLSGGTRDSSRHDPNGAVNKAANTNSQKQKDSITLSPQQLQAAQLAQQQRQIKRRRDSVYNAHKQAIFSALGHSALSIDNNQPDYSIFFPDYFYDNGANKGNGALVNLHAAQNRDLLFYAFIGITLLLALIKVIFPRYFNQVFWFFLHPNDRKNNVSDQISGQNVFPSLLLNLFFVLTGGLFLAQIIRPNLPGADFWTTWLLFSLLLAGVYLVKFLVILLSGWVFGAPAAATIYNQVVFSINKIIGLILLPATLLISYGSVSTLGHVFFTVVVIIVILLIYRYIASFLLIKGKLKVSPFHFILYLCAVEIIPLLLVYKVLLTNLGRFI